MSAYVIAEIEIHDATAFEDYRRQVSPTIATFGGRYVVRGGSPQPFEGGWKPERIVVLEFPSIEQARRWYDSADYAPAKALRQRAATTRAILVEGL